MRNIIRSACMGIGALAMFALAGCGDDPGADVTEAEPQSPTPSMARAAEDQTANGAILAPGQQATATPQRSEPRPPSTAPAGERTREAVDPDSYTLGLIYYDWSGDDPGLDALAEQRVRVGGTYDGYAVNEFNRKQFVDAERTRLNALFDEGRGVGTIVMSIGGQLGEYDPGYGEFYIGPFAPGSTVSAGHSTSWDRDVQEAIRARNETYRDIKNNLFAVVAFSNALDAYVWQVPQEEAEKIIARFEREGNRGRNVYARTRLKILGTNPRNSRGQQEIETEVQSFTLFTDQGTELAAFDIVK